MLDFGAFSARFNRVFLRGFLYRLLRRLPALQVVVGLQFFARFLLVFFGMLQQGIYAVFMPLAHPDRKPETAR